MARDDWDKYGKNWKYYKNPRKKYLEDKPKVLKGVRITFGKYKGRCLDQIPHHYLEWLLDSGAGLAWEEEINNILRRKNG